MYFLSVGTLRIGEVSVPSLLIFAKHMVSMDIAVVVWFPLVPFLEIDVYLSIAQGIIINVESVRLVIQGML